LRVVRRGVAPATCPLIDGRGTRRPAFENLCIWRIHDGSIDRYAAIAVDDVVGVFQDLRIGFDWYLRDVRDQVLGLTQKGRTVDEGQYATQWFARPSGRSGGRGVDDNRRCNRGSYALAVHSRGGGLRAILCRGQD